MMLTANYRAHHARLRKQGNMREAQIAELVSEGWSIPAASAHLGISGTSGRKYWRRIVESMGEQAR